MSQGVQRSRSGGDNACWLDVKADVLTDGTVAIDRTPPSQEADNTRGASTSTARYSQPVEPSVIYARCESVLDIPGPPGGGSSRDHVHSPALDRFLLFSHPMLIAASLDLSFNEARRLQMNTARRRISIRSLEERANGSQRDEPAAADGGVWHPDEGNQQVSVSIDDSNRDVGSIAIVPVSSLLMRDRFIATGSDVMDKMLHGGLMCASITEVVGRPMSGKSNLVSNWIASAAVRGAVDKLQRRCDDVTLGGGAVSCVVVTTGHTASTSTSTLSAKHVSELMASYTATTLLALHHQTSEQRGAPAAPGRLREQDVYNVASTSVRWLALSTLDALEEALPVIASHFIIEASHVTASQPSHVQSTATDGDSGGADRSPPPWLAGGSLLVIDSFSVLVQNSLSSDPTDSLQRHDVLAKWTQRLKVLADRYCVAVVITNFGSAPSTSIHSSQAVGEVQGHHKQQQHPYRQQRGIATVGYFGNTFYHAVNHRLLCDRVTIDGTVTPVVGVVKSPVCPAIAFRLSRPRPSVMLRPSPLHVTAELLQLEEAPEWFAAELAPATRDSQESANGEDIFSVSIPPYSAIDWSWVGCDSFWRAPRIPPHTTIPPEYGGVL